MLVEAFLCTELGVTPNSVQMLNMFDEQKYALYNLIIKLEDKETIKIQTRFLEEVDGILGMSDKEILGKDYDNLKSVSANSDIANMAIKKTADSVRRVEIKKIEDKYGFTYRDNNLSEEELRKKEFEEAKEKLKLMNENMIKELQKER